MNNGLRTIIRNEWILISAVAAAVVVRGYNLLDQIVVDDEWHMLHIIQKLGYWDIATNLGVSDHSIPLSLFYKFISGTIGLAEWNIRLPFFAAGILTILLFSTAVRRIYGKPAGLIFAWLLALCPLHIFYSRFARPYIFTFFLASFSLYVFLRWWESGKRRFAALYVASAILGLYLHLAILPFVLSPFALFMAVRIFSRSKHSGPALVQAGLLAVLIGFLILLLLGPAFIANPDSLVDKVRANSFSLPLATYVKSFPMIFAMKHAWMTWILVLCVAAGFFLFVKKGGLFSLLFLFAAASQLVLLEVSSPRGADNPWILLRYVFHLMPLLFLFITLAIVWLTETLMSTFKAGRYFRWCTPFLCFALGACLFLEGPLPSIMHRPNNWTANLLLFRLTGKYETWKDRITRMSQFYRDLGHLPPGSATLCEFPWYLNFSFNQLPLYQRIHRQRTVIGFTTGISAQNVWGEFKRDFRKIDFENFVFVDDLPSLEKRSVDFIVCHKNLKAEIEWNIPPRFLHFMIPYNPDIRLCMQYCQQKFGMPVFEDEYLAVFPASPEKRALPIEMR